ncbi:hypothetical protein MMC25_005495 [Agyrium rufum]|nr:hypothetical protein [Agyrium rufum]
MSLTPDVATKPLIIDLTWSKQPGHTPSFPPNFESLARRLRYQALGKACAAKGVQSILVGHHADDNAETILMRLASGRNRLGLRGISASCGIPECIGIHGIAESDRAKPPSRVSLTQPDLITHLPWRQVIDSVMPVEYGGISLHRPLLPFPKARIRQTCLENSIEWVEDESNSDLALTQRNTVRHLLTEGRLPKSLQFDALQGVIQYTSGKWRVLEDSIRCAFDACVIFDFNPLAGSLTFQFPSQRHFWDSDSLYYLDRWRFALLLRKLLSIVTPRTEISPEAMDGTASKMRELLRLASLRAAKGPNLNPLTSVVIPGSFKTTNLAGICIALVTRCNHSVPYLQNEARPDADETILKEFTTRNGLTWRLSREPFSDRSQPNNFLISPSKVSSLGQPAEDTPFQLWDGRYWIKVRNNGKEPLFVRPFQESYLKPFRASWIDESSRTQFDRSLATLSPANERWTLPAITTKQDLVALPTLGQNLIRSDWKDLVSWDVRWKKVHLPGDIVE